LLDGDGRVRGAVAVSIDITDRKRAEQALYDEKERAQVTLASIGDAVIRTGSDGRVEYMNPVAETLTGWTQAEAVGLALPEVFDIVDQHTGAQVANPVVSCLECGQVTQMAEDVVLIGRHGVRHAIENSAAPIRDRAKKILGVVLVFHDVTEQRRLSNQISYQATHDMLTGLVNRHEFELRVDRAIASAQANSSQHVLCYMDLDQFKVVNDTCGHVAGDQLLRQLASVLGGRVRARDTLARLGGDEFGLLLEHCLLEQGQRVANALREAVDEFRFVWAGRSFRIGVSIGLVSIDRNIGDQAAVLQAADSACYVAKDAGRNRVHTYDQHDAELARRHGEMQWIARIQQALDEELFRLHAQAIVPLCAPVTAGIYCELLVRMAENAGTLVMPGSFMPAAERYHLAAHIDRWVVDQAFRWLDDNPRRLARLALCTINLSAQSLSDEQFLNNILSQFDRLQLPSSKICFEITETAAIGNLSDAIHFITRLKARGCRFALDDFGSGLSSFAYLKSLAVDFLKIDGVFVKDVVDDPVDFAMVRSINEIGQLLGKQTIAEHVENPAIIERLRDVGVDYVQGYGVGMPQPLEYLLGEEN
jgi:diguanylate cyclase (GGDEF)-like protein/PAS domain S-box-containing protein